MDEIYLRFGVAFLVGAMLSLSGSLIQLTSQNDLAGSSTLGIDALCVLVILAVHSFFIFSPLAIPTEIVSLTLLILVSLVLFAVALRKNKKNSEHQNKYFSQVGFFIFVGLCFNLFIGTIFYFLEFVFTTHGWVFPSQLWFGNFRFILPQAHYLLMAGFLLFYFLALKLSREIKIISFSKDLGYGLGINVKKLEVTSLIFAIMITALVTSLFGVFAFVGIIFPHFWRNFAFIKYNAVNEIKWSPLLSGALFAIADMICYYFPVSGSEIPVGMLTSVMGSFSLMILLFKRESKKLKKSLL